MDYSPLRNVGRFVLAACAVSLGVASLGAQTVPSTTAPMGPNPSRVDVFLGYSYFGAHGQLKPAGINYSSIDYGAIGSGAYYFNKYVGAEMIFAAHPNGKNDDVYTMSAGPIFRAPMENFTLFAHGLAGAARVDGPNSHNGTYFNPYQWGPALTAGGGMDYDLPFFNHRFSLRLFQADYRYIHENYGPYTPPPTGGVMGGRAGGTARQALMTKNKMTDKAEKAVLAGLRWLKTHQSADGSWGNEHKPAMTGLAVLCFLGHGETPESAEFGPTVKKGLDWLLAKGTEFQGKMSMTRDGWGSGNAGVYEHAIASYAMGEYYTMTKDERFAELLKQAIGYIVQGHDENVVWQYSY